MAFPPIAAEAPAAGGAPGGWAGLIAIILTTLTGFVVAATGFVRVFFPEGRKKVGGRAPVIVEPDDPTFAERAWRETLEQLDAANDRAERAETDARHWRDRYVKLLEEGLP